MKLNPFHIIAAETPVTAEIVTIPILLRILEILKSGNVILDQVSEAFTVLEYLAEHRVLELNTLEDGTYTIKRIEYVS